jgi:hypothetical protein
MNAPVGGYDPVWGRGTGCGECGAADDPRSDLLARCFDSGSVRFTNNSKTGGKYADREVSQWTRPDSDPGTPGEPTRRGAGTQPSLDGGHTVTGKREIPGKRRSDGAFVQLQCRLFRLVRVVTEPAARLVGVLGSEHDKIV